MKKNLLILFLTVSEREIPYDIVVQTMIKQIYQLATTTAYDTKINKLRVEYAFNLMSIQYSKN